MDARSALPSSDQGPRAGARDEVMEVGSGATGRWSKHLTRRPGPGAGLRPTVVFCIVAPLTAAYAAFAVWVSDTWRSELAHAIGPIAAWLIPVTLAYIPAVAMGFFMFTLLVTRYHHAPLVAPVGSWPANRWPAVTILIAALNEEDVIAGTLERIAELGYDGFVEVVLADNGSTDHTAAEAAAAAERLGVNYRRVTEAAPGKHHALNAALTAITTPLVVTVDADTRTPPGRAQIPGGSHRDHTTGPACLRVCRRPRARESDGQFRYQDAAVGLSPGDQRRKEHAGHVQQRARGAGRIVRVLGRGPGGRSRMARRDR